MTAASFWWGITLLASFAQTLRNAMQRDLIGALGPIGAAEVRFLFGLPFAMLFFAGVALSSGQAPPRLTGAVLGWAVVGGVAQIIATATMLAAMRERSFVVVIAATKTEAAQAALFALIVLGERPTPMLLGSIVLATLGVWLMSNVRGGVGGVRPLALGLLSAAFFAVAAVSFRASVLAVSGASFLMAASFTLVLGLMSQTAFLIVYLAAFDRPAIGKILAAWRPSLFAGFLGALASQLWFVAFALSDVARVRTLALVEVLFAQMVSQRLFKEPLRRIEIVGIVLVVAAAALLVSGATA